MDGNDEYNPSYVLGATARNPQRLDCAWNTWVSCHEGHEVGGIPSGDYIAQGKFLE